MITRIAPGPVAGIRAAQVFSGAQPASRPGSLCLLVFSLLLCFAPAALAWEIESFDARLAVQADGSLLVTETIRADFRGESKQGIYRDIPLVTQDRLGVRRSIRLGFLSATDESGNPWQAHLSKVGVYRRIRLGTPGVYHTGEKTYVLSYRVERILQAYPEHDELYWNVTGNGWAVPIRSASARVTLPTPAPPGTLKAAVYTGSYGSTARDAQIETERDSALRFDTRGVLGPFEGMTLVAGWPSGLVPLPGARQKLLWFFQDNRLFLLPLLVLAGMLFIWSRAGRDPAHQAVAVQYEPPEGMTPGEIGALADEKVDMRDITATLVDLARRGHLSIEEMKGKEYVFTRRSGPAEKLKSHEQKLLAALFSGKKESVRLSDLENKFYEHLPEIRRSLYGGLIGQRYWWSRPDTARRRWGAAAAVLAVLGVFGMGIDEGPGPVMFAAWGSALVIALFAPFMPRRTLLGARTREKVLGLQEFLRRTDEDRLRREKDPAALFERLLPCAMALGVANQWAKAFEGIYQVQPAWFTSYDGSSFTPGDFGRRMETAASRMESTLSSTPRSSGGSGFSGGSSGGGGGGGGGGSW